MAITTTDLILYVLVGAVAGMIYGLKRIFYMEAKIAKVEKNILSRLPKRRK